MPSPFESQYADAGTADTITNLATSSSVITTSLAADITDTETDLILVDNAGDAEFRGVLGIDDEIIIYHQYYRDEPGTICNLERGMFGTTPASHIAGTDITILASPKFDNPALASAMMAVQDKLLAGASGNFTTVDGKTVTVLDGIITSIV